MNAKKRVLFAVLALALAGSAVGIYATASLAHFGNDCGWRCPSQEWQDWSLGNVWG